MIVRFKSDVGGFTMFGDVAQQLLRMAGHSGTVPGAIPAEGIKAARDKLRVVLGDAQDDGEATEPDDGDDSAEPSVPLRRRAFPLLELLDNAITEGCGIRWDQP